MSKRAIIIGALVGVAALAATQSENDTDLEQHLAREDQAGYEGSDEDPGENSQGYDVFSEMEAERKAGQPVQAQRQSLSPQSARASMQSPTTTPQDGMHVRPAQIMDTQGFGRPLVAATMLIPTGWQTQGGVVWELNNSGCGRNNPHYNWAASSPDGLGMISLLPDETWQGNSSGIQNGNCPNVTISDPKQAVLSYVSRYRPGAQVLDYFDRTQDVKEYFKGIVPSRRDGFGGETRQWFGAGQAVIAYQVNGQSVKEIIGTSVLFTGMTMQGGYGMPQQHFLTIGILPGYAMRLPEAQFDLNVAEQIRKSIRPGQEWNQEMAQHRAKIAGINIKGARDRSRIIAKHNQEMSEIRQKSWESSQRSSDRMQRETSEAIRGVETYDDPMSSTGTVELDHTYDHAYRLDSGDYVLTNDHSFNPYEQFGQGAEELTPTQ